MTVSTKVEPMRIVSIYPYTRGFAYAVMDSALEVIESRLFDIKEYDHQKTMELSQNVILKHQPSIVILENTILEYLIRAHFFHQLLKPHSTDILSLYNCLSNIKYMLYLDLL